MCGLIIDGKVEVLKYKPHVIVSLSPSHLSGGGLWFEDP